MDKKNQKTGKFYMRLNSLSQDENDPTLLNALFIIHDFELSYNGQVITEEICRENMNSLVNKPIVCKYIPKSENDGLDALTDHELCVDTDRNTGEKFITTDTVPIGNFTDVYIDDFEDESGETKRVLYGKAVLWFDKNRNVCLLLEEWLDRGIVIPASVEYLYSNYNVSDGIEYIQSPIIYVAHALLNAEDRNDYEKVYPAYDSARLISANMDQQWDKVVAQAIEQNKGNKGNKNTNRKEEKKMGKEKEMFKKVCELSFDDVRTKIYQALSQVMSDDEYESMWIYDIWSTYFIYYSYSEQKYYKVNYTKDEATDAVTVDMDSKIEVEENISWIEVTNKLKQAEKNLNEREKEIAELKETNEKLTKELNTATKDKESLSDKLDNATTAIASINEKLEGLKEIEKVYNQAKFEKELKERKEEFEKKFKGLNAIEKFNSDEVQELIKKSINDKDALISLNSMLIDLIPEAEDNDNNKNVNIKKGFNNKEIKDLIPEDDSFESRYFE